MCAGCHWVPLGARCPPLGAAEHPTEHPLEFEYKAVHRSPQLSKVTEPAIYLIFKFYLDYDVRTRTLVRIAQISPDFRRYALDDIFWTRFDVHKVRGSPDNLYTYCGYQITGIVAHYFNYLASGDEFRLLGHFGSDYAKFLDTSELYD